MVVQAATHDFSKLKHERPLGHYLFPYSRELTPVDTIITWLISA